MPSPDRKNTTPRKNTTTKRSPVQHGTKYDNPAIRRIFLDQLATGCSVTAAATVAGVGRATVFEWKAAEPEFAAQWESAVEQGVDLLEDEAMRRAKHGFTNPVFQGGMEVGQVQVYSDTLMQLMLKGKRPARYGTDRTELTGKNGGPLQVQSIEIEFVDSKVKK